MATATQQRKLKGLFEQTMPKGGRFAFREAWEQSVGVHQRELSSGARVPFFDGQKRELEHGNWQVGEVMYSMLGPRWKESFEQFWSRGAESRFEGVGQSITSGDTPYVTAALDVVAGLMNARALERAASPEWIWDRMCQVQEATGEGGFHIGSRVSPTNVAFRDLGDSQSLPTAKATSTRVHRNRSLKQGLRAKVNYWQLRDDLTSQIMETVDQFALIVQSERERKVADGAMGISSGTTLATGVNIGALGQAMPVVQDGLTWFPWLSGSYGSNAGAGINAPENNVAVANYANNGTGGGDGQGLTDYTAIVRAIQILTKNRDPFTGLPVQVPFIGMQFFVPTEAAKVQLEFLLRAKVLWQVLNAVSPANAAFSNTASEYNLVENMKLEILTSQYWANRLTDVGAAYCAANAATPQTLTRQVLTNNAGDTYATAGSVMSFFMMGRFRDALIYWQRQPYHTVSVPPSSVDIGEETVLIQDHRERGQLFWSDKMRHAFRTWS